MGTLSHYRAESENNRKSLLEEKESKAQQYKEEIDRKLLMEFRPYIIFEEVDDPDKKALSNIERYVYASDEPIDDWANLSNYDVADDQKVTFRLHNVGLGPAENINIVDGDYSDICLKLHFSKRMQESIYTKFISLTFQYDDIRHNKISRTMSMDLKNNRILGWNEQQYIGKENQSLFDGETKI